MRPYIAGLHELIILGVGDGLQPLVGGVLAWDGESEVREPAVLGCSVPVLYVGGDVDDGAGQDLLGRLALLLVPAASGHTDEHLAATLAGVVDVPVVAAAGLECHVGAIHLAAGDWSQVGIADEVLGICSVGLSDGENHFLLEAFLFSIGVGGIGPHLPGEAEPGPGVDEKWRPKKRASVSIPAAGS